MHTVSVERALAEAQDIQERGIIGVYPLSVVALAAEVAALRRDAERYRWLRDGCNEKDSPATHIAANRYGLEWDAAIDAAMAADAACAA